MSVTQSDKGTDPEQQSGIDELRGAIGWTGPPRTHLIEAGRVAAFREAIGESVGEIVPPTFLACFIDTPPLLTAASKYGTGWLNGGDHMRYLSAVRIGQTVTSQMRFAAAIEKQGSSGPMAVLTFVTTFVSARGEVLAEHTGTRIRR